MKQTTELAIDIRTDALVHSHTLLDMSDEHYNDFERDFYKYRLENQGQSAYRCGICMQPVHLGHRESALGKNRFFVHGTASDCPWYTGLSVGDLLERGHYMALRESPRHRTLIDALHSVLSADPDWRDVHSFRFKPGFDSCRTPKIADIHGSWRGRFIAFEFHTKSTRLPGSILKDLKVVAEGGTLFWLFEELTESSFEIQEALYNQRNLFTWDARNAAVSHSLGRIVLTTTFSEPKVDETTHLKSLHKRHVDVELPQLTFSNDRPRAFYFNFTIADQEANAAMPVAAFGTRSPRGGRYRFERVDAPPAEPIDLNTLFPGPDYQWNPIDSDHIHKEMAFLTNANDGSDWASLLRALLDPERPAQVRDAVKLWSAQFNIREGTLKNFLVHSGYIYNPARRG